MSHSSQKDKDKEDKIKINDGKKKGEETWDKKSKDSQHDQNVDHPKGADKDKSKIKSKDKSKDKKEDKKEAAAAPSVPKLTLSNTPTPSVPSKNTQSISQGTSTPHKPAISDATPNSAKPPSSEVPSNTPNTPKLKKIKGKSSGTKKKSTL